MKMSRSNSTGSVIEKFFLNFMTLSSFGVVDFGVFEKKLEARRSFKRMVDMGGTVVKDDGLRKNQAWLC